VFVEVHDGEITACVGGNYTERNGLQRIGMSPAL
jgi:hypothetical protein